MPHPMELRSYGALAGREDMDAEGFTQVGAKKKKKKREDGRRQSHLPDPPRTPEAGTPLRDVPPPATTEAKSNVSGRGQPRLPAASGHTEAGTPLRADTPPTSKGAAANILGVARAHSCSPRKRLIATDCEYTTDGDDADVDEDEDEDEEAPVEAPALTHGSPTVWSISSNGSFPSAYRMVSWLENELQLSLRVEVTRAGTLLLTGADAKAATALAEVAAGRPRGICLRPRERTTTGVMMGFPIGLPLDPLIDRPEVRTAERCSVNLAGGRKALTRQVRVVFAGQRPAAIDLGCWGRYQVRPFTREPLRCYKCQAFGHHQQHCTNERDICGVCSGDHPSSGCIQKLREGAERPRPQCPNCGDRHHAWSPRCPARPRPRSTGAQESSTRPPTDTTTTIRRRRRRQRRRRRGSAVHATPPAAATTEPIAAKETTRKSTREACTQTDPAPTQAERRPRRSRDIGTQARSSPAESASEKSDSTEYGPTESEPETDPEDRRRHKKYHDKLHGKGAYERLQQQRLRQKEARKYDKLHGPGAYERLQQQRLRQEEDRKSEI